jgi:hypothetical protein
MEVTFHDPMTVAALLALPALLGIVLGCILLKRAFESPNLLPEEIALAVAYVFLVGSLVWLGAFLSRSTILGFGSPWTWITAAHFAFAGFGALTITALSCRVVADKHALRILRFLLVAHPITYLITAAGISGFPYCNELGAVGYQLIFTIQFVAVVFGRPTRIPRLSRFLLLLALAVPVVAVVPAMAWAWGRPILDIVGMIRYHGVANAIGHVGLGFIAFSWGRPPAQRVINLEVNVAAPEPGFMA